MKNAQLLNSSLMASLAMSRTKKTSYKTTQIILSKPCKIKNFFKCYENEIINFLVEDKAIIKAYASNHSLQNKNFSELIVPPTYMKVEFKDTLAKIALLE